MQMKLRCPPGFIAGHSDGVLVRYSADTVSTWPSSSGSPTDCLGQIVDTQITNRYYAKASSSTAEPELYCEGSGEPGSAQPLVEGVERLRIDYWLRDAALPLAAGAVPRERWPMVVAADICVLVRGEPMGQTDRVQYQDCDGTRIMSNDTRARQAFWRRVAVRNGGLS
jgi:type IV pilus assembly protein PilW